MSFTPFGPYRAIFNPQSTVTLTEKAWEKTVTTLQSGQAQPLSSGKDAVYTATIDRKKIAIKQFKHPSKLKQWSDHNFKGGIRAERNWQIAMHLWANHVPTPEPIAFIRDNNTGYDYYLSVYTPSSNLRDELSHIYWETFSNTALISLLTYTAEAIRQLHDAGVMHGDLGNQNILLNSTRLLPNDAQSSKQTSKKAGTKAHPNETTEDGGAPESWQDIAIIDLDRAKIFNQLTLKQRAKDFQRLKLPSDYLRVFKHMYWQGEEIPIEFDRYAKQYRRAYLRHGKSHRWRHPIRTLRKTLSQRADTKARPYHCLADQSDHSNRPDYPEDNDIWIWDDKSAQAMAILDRQDKKKYRSYWDYIKMILNVAIQHRAIKQHYRVLCQKSFQQPIPMQDKIGIALHPHPDYQTIEPYLLKELGCTSVLIRFCHHENQSTWQQTIHYIQTLKQQNINVAVALLQSRCSVINPESWASFVNFVVNNIHDHVDWIEIGHAINRVKWGIWQTDEYIALLKPFIRLKQHYPQLNLIGPAVIDFEWPRVVYALKKLPKQLKLFATSVHLYVDRRGAPENKQNGYSTLEKCALNKAIADCSPHSNNRFIISETNWPIQNTGVYSPIGSPYMTPAWHRDKPGVSETDYARYMIRYLAITLCSGHVDQVYWWRLSAHGYGLVDDMNNFEKRPAFFALKTFLNILGNATFEKRLSSHPDTYLLEFNTPDKGKILLAWTTKSHDDLPTAIGIREIWDINHQAIKVLNTLKLTDSPIYCRLATATQPPQHLAQ